MNTPPASPQTLLRGVLQGMVALLEVHRRARTLHIPRSYLQTWMAQIEEAIRLLENEEKR